MIETSNIFRFKSKHPYDNWTLKKGVLKGYYPRNSLVNLYSQTNNGVEINHTSWVIGSDVKIIHRNCFRNNKRFETLIISEGAESIEDYAFYNARVKKIWIPNSVKHIRQNSFSKNITLLVHKNSYGERYAIKNGLKHYYYLDEFR